MKLRICSLLLALALLPALFCVSCAKKGADGAPTGYVSASDEQADFILYVPQKWTVDLSTAAAGAYYSASDPSSVSVMAWELPNTDTSLDDWWELNRSELESVFTVRAKSKDIELKVSLPSDLPLLGLPSVLQGAKV